MLKLITSIVVLFASTFAAIACNAGEQTNTAFASSISAQSPAGEPSLPKVILNIAPVPPSGRIVKINAGASVELQNAINKAKAGDIIELAAGATFSGNFVLPRLTTGRRTGETRPSEWVHIRSSAHSQLPPSGSRVTPAQDKLLPKLVTPNGDPVLVTERGAAGFRFTGIEFTMAPGIRVGNLIKLGSGDETEGSQLPRDIIIDRCYIHGLQRSNLRRGIALNSASTAIVDSYISEVHEEGADSQAICGWNGPGPFKIVNNYLEAAGENVMFGGADPRITDLVPSDIEFKSNHCFKPLRWKKGDPTYDGSRWAVKNLFELKNARRVLIEGNTFQNVWVDAQTGYAILFKSVNQDGRAPWSVTEDVEFRNNIVRRCAAGLNIQGRAGDQQGANTRRIAVRNNLFDGIGGEMRGEGTFLKVSETHDLIFDHNTVNQSGNIITAYGPPSERFTFINNLIRNAGYGIKGDGTKAGTDTLQRFFPGHVFKKNVLVGRAAVSYPDANFVVEGEDILRSLSEGQAVSANGVHKRAGTDGKDIGCDLAAIKSVVRL